MAERPTSPQVILVTGASAGIGWACAARLAAHGATVVGASRRATAAPGCSALSMDVDRDDSVTDGVATVLERHGRLDAVVACAGWGLAGPVELTPIADAKAQLETNFWGAVRVVQAALLAMRSQGHGRVVLISSIGGVIGIPYQAFYSASKFAMEGYGEALAYEVAPFGIHVTLVEPGNVRTDFTASRRKAGGGSPRGHSASAGAAADSGAGTGASAGAQPDDPYAAAAERAISLMEREEAAGVPPASVAKVVESVLSATRPPRRVSVGKSGERVGLLAKRILPYRVFESAARGSLGA